MTSKSHTRRGLSALQSGNSSPRGALPLRSLARTTLHKLRAQPAQRNRDVAVGNMPRPDVVADGYAVRQTWPRLLSASHGIAYAPFP